MQRIQACLVSSTANADIVVTVKVRTDIYSCSFIVYRNEGPEKNKENLLLLDRMEDWLGRKRPAVLGKEGAEAALERGEKTLADILNRANDYDEDSFGGESAADGTLLKDGWVEGIGEARADEDNLSLYLRMSEGAGEG